MDINTLGEFAFIDRLTKPFTSNVAKGIGDDASVIEIGGKQMLISKDLMMEGVDFDLTYYPLHHLGYKSVVKAISDIVAMNGTPKYIMVGIAISARFTVEHIEEIYSGIKSACETYEVELIGGDTNSSLTGLSLSVTAIGEAEKESITYRSGAKINDLVCVTGDLGASYLGVKLLEREKYVLNEVKGTQPKFEGYEYQLQRALKPRCRLDLVQYLKSISVVPTSMIDISDGLASDIKQICKSSDCSANIYLDKLPVVDSTYELAEDLKSDWTVSVMNGGEDYEMLFTLPTSEYDKIVGMDGVSIIGHITSNQNMIQLISPDGAEIEITAQGWR